MEKRLKLPQGITGAMFNQWRAKHGKLLIVTVETESERKYIVDGNEIVFDDESESEKEKAEAINLIGVFRQPDLPLLGEVEKKYKTDAMGSLKLLFNGCKLAVDEEIINDTSLYLSCANQLKKLTSQKKSSSQMF